MLKSYILDLLPNYTHNHDKEYPPPLCTIIWAMTGRLLNHPLNHLKLTWLVIVVIVIVVVVVVVVVVVERRLVTRSRIFHLDHQGVSLLDQNSSGKTSYESIQKGFYRCSLFTKSKEEVGHLLEEFFFFLASLSTSPMFLCILWASKMCPVTQ
jgi:hypothetical protein